MLCTQFSHWFWRMWTRSLVVSCQQSPKCSSASPPFSLYVYTLLLALTIQTASQVYPACSQSLLFRPPSKRQLEQSVSTELPRLPLCWNLFIDSFQTLQMTPPCLNIAYELHVRHLNPLPTLNINSHSAFKIYKLIDNFSCHNGVTVKQIRKTTRLTMTEKIFFFFFLAICSMISMTLAYRLSFCLCRLSII